MLVQPNCETGYLHAWFLFLWVLIEVWPPFPKQWLVIETTLPVEEKIAKIKLN